MIQAREACGAVRVEGFQVMNSKNKSRIFVLLIFLFVFLFLSGLGTRYRVCSVCEVQGNEELHLFGLHLHYFVKSQIPKDPENFEYDEFGTMKMWEEINGSICKHLWHFRQNLFFSLIKYESGGLYRGITGGYKSYALKALSKTNKVWAKLVWDKMIKTDETNFIKIAKIVDDLGMLCANKDGFDVVTWWKKNEYLFSQ